MIGNIAIDETRICECGQPLSVMRWDWGLKWGCIECCKVTVLKSITRSDVYLCCSLVNADSDFICYVFETLRQQDYPLAGYECDVDRTAISPLLRYGVPVYKYVQLENESQLQSLRNFTDGVALPLFTDTIKKKWGRGYRTQTYIETKALLRADYVGIGEEEWAHVQGYSDVLNRLRVNDAGFLI